MTLPLDNKNDTLIGRLLIVFLLILPSVLSFAQGPSKFTISGYLKDSISSETIIGATISVNGHGKGVTSNQYGFFSLTLPAGEYDITITHVGYNTQKRTIQLDKNAEADFFLSPKSTTYAEVVVTSKRRDANVKSA